MSNPTLYLPKIPMVGQSGKRDNVAVLLHAMGCLMPPGTVIDVTIGHDSACPCIDVAQDLTHCLCEYVNLSLETRELPEPEGGA